MNVPRFIRLEVTGSGDAAKGEAATMTFGVKGGRFGRAADNDWVINHEYVSRYQGRIGFANGRFYVCADPDASAELFLNGPTQKVLATQQAPLATGDRLLVDELVIRVAHVGESRSERAPSARATAPALADFSNPFDTDSSPFDTGAEASNAASGGDILSVFGPGTEPDPAFEEPRRTVESNQNPLDDHYTPPPARPAMPNLLDEDWYKQPPKPGQAPGAVPPVPTPGRVGPGADTPRLPLGVSPGSPQISADLVAFLKGAGIEEHMLTPEVMANLGAVMRVVVDGVVDILRARKDLRREFRIPTTQVEGDRNNPLKISLNAEDALQNIFLKRNAGFLPALTAFEEAFDDLRSHQLAMLKGLRVAYGAMLARFDPDGLERRFEPPGKGNAFKGLAGRPKFWEQYRAWYAEVSEDPEDCFRRLFGDEFAKAYEQQLQLLARSRRKRRTGE